MESYQFGLGFRRVAPINVKRLDGVFIPFDQANTDCAQFLTDWKAGAEVLDADGKPVPYSDDAANAFGLGPT